MTWFLGKRGPGHTSSEAEGQGYHGKLNRGSQRTRSQRNGCQLCSKTAGERPSRAKGNPRCATEALPRPSCIDGRVCLLRPHGQNFFFGCAESLQIFDSKAISLILIFPGLAHEAAKTASWQNYLSACCVRSLPIVSSLRQESSLFEWASAYWLQVGNQ